MNKILYFLFFFLFIFNLQCQSLNDIEIQFDSISNKFSVRQLIIINKLDICKEDYLYLYDWNNSYSSFNSPLSKKLYSEYDSSLLKPQANLSGRTNIKNVLINGVIVDWERLDKNIDIIKINNVSSLNNNELKIFINYDLFLPRYSITNNGNKNNKLFYFKNSFLRIVPFLNNNPIIQSNVDLDDQFVYSSNFKLRILNNNKFKIITNADYIAKNEKFIEYELINSRNLELIFDLKNEFEKININDLALYSDSNNIKISQQDILKRINNFIHEKFKNPIKKIIVNKENLLDYSIYPYSEIPTFISPIDKKILTELNIIKFLISKNLHKNLNFNKRTNFWFFSGLEIYFLNEYISKYYNDLKLLGKFSSLFIIKKHNISNYKFSDQFKLVNQFVSSRNIEQKLSISSEKLTRFNYVLNSPYLSYFNLSYLKIYLGDKSFNYTIKKIMNSEMKNNNSIRKIFDINNKKELDWFFDDILNLNTAFDFKVTKIDKSNFEISNSFTTKNKIPLLIKKEYNNYSIQNWILFNRKYKDSYSDNLNNIIINPDFILNENNYKNNFLSKKGLNKLKFTLFSDFENYKSNQVFYRPIINYNLYDGILTGLTLTNQSPLKKNFLYFISPQLSSRTKKILGSVSFNYRDIISKTKSIKYFLSYSNFNYEDNLKYSRFSPSIIYSIKDSDLKSNFRQFFIVRHVNINKELNSFENSNYGVSNFSYINSNPGAKKTYSFLYNFQINNEIIKNSITFSYRNYFQDFKQFNFRIFLGKFFKNTSNDDFFNFNIHSSNDYLFSNNLIGRSESEGFYSQQYVKYEGAFKSKLRQEKVNDFILVIGSGVTLWKWLESYFDYGFFKQKSKKLVTGYDLGLKLNIVENYLELYFPVLNSDEFILKSNNYTENIRFTLSLDPEDLSSLFTRRWF